jgi:hypothetical protein
MRKHSGPLIFGQHQIAAEWFPARVIISRSFTLCIENNDSSTIHFSLQRHKHSFSISRRGTSQGCS